MARYVFAIDQGIIGMTALVIDRRLSVKAKVNIEFRQIFPWLGQVEHDFEDIWASMLKAVQGALRAARLKGSVIEVIGITNQRETIVLWDRCMGKPVHHVIVWQDWRTAPACQALKDQ